jgi:hypothetical protein
LQTTGIFTTHYVRIPFEKWGVPIYLIPFGDVHRSSKLCSLSHWKEFLRWAAKKPRAFFLGMGDYDDMASASERSILCDDRLHESTVDTLEETYLKATEKLAKEIEPFRGKLIGLLEGNHFGTFQNGTTTTQKLCELMGCKYLGVSSFIRLSFAQKTGGSHNTTCSVDVWAHHGVGASRLVGGSLNRVEQMLDSADCDIALMGHDHKKAVGDVIRLKLTGGNGSLRVTSRKVVFGRTGSFLRGYVDGKRSYVADCAMKPLDVGVIKIEMTPRREDTEPRSEGRAERVWIDLHASI